MPSQDVPAALDLEVLKQFRTIFQSVRQHFDSIQRNCDISGAQLWALSRIAAEPGLRVSGLAQAMALHQSTVSNLVEGLAGKGLVLREKSPADQRVVLLRPTAAGLAIAAQAPQPAHGLLPDALARLDPATLQTLQGCLAEVLAAMQGRTAAGSDAGMDTPLSDIR